MSKYIFNIYGRNEFGDHIPNQKKTIKIVRANVVSAKDFAHRKYPKCFIELESVEHSDNDLLWEVKRLQWEKRNHLEKIYSRLEFGHYDMANELIKKLIKINEDLSLLK